MAGLIDQLATYAAYHRNPRNIATHMIGIPLIVFGVEVLLSRPVVAAGEVVLTPAMPVSAIAALFYLRLDLMFGALMAMILALLCWIGFGVAEQSTARWLATGIGAFVAGWGLQFVGHGFEGRKPAFLDDLRGLLIGPLFILAEIVFALGGRRAVKEAMTADRRA